MELQKSLKRNPKKQERSKSSKKKKQVEEEIEEEKRDVKQEPLHKAGKYVALLNEDNPRLVKIGRVRISVLIY